MGVTESKTHTLGDKFFGKYLKPSEAMLSILGTVDHFGGSLNYYAPNHIISFDPSSRSPFIVSHPGCFAMNYSYMPQ